MSKAGPTTGAARIFTEHVPGLGLTSGMEHGPLRPVWDTSGPCRCHIERTKTFREEHGVGSLRFSPMAVKLLQGRCDNTWFNMFDHNLKLTFLINARDNLIVKHPKYS